MVTTNDYDQKQIITGYTTPGSITTVLTIEADNIHGGIINILNTDPASNLTWQVDSYAHPLGIIPSHEKEAYALAPTMQDSFLLDGKVRGKYVVFVQSGAIPCAYRIEWIAD